MAIVVLMAASSISFAQSCGCNSSVAPVMSYAQPMMTYQQPMVTYSQPMVTYQQPMMSYSQPLVQQPMMTYSQPLVQQPMMNQAISNGCCGVGYVHPSNIVVPGINPSLIQPVFSATPPTDADYEAFQNCIENCRMNNDTDCKRGHCSHVCYNFFIRKVNEVPVSPCPDDSVLPVYPR